MENLTLPQGWDCQLKNTGVDKHYVITNYEITLIFKEEYMNTFMNELETLHYKNNPMGEPIPVRQKITLQDLRRDHLYQLANKHHASGLKNYTQTFMDIRGLQGKMKWTGFENKK